MRNYFEGCYYKHQMNGHTLCIIVGKSDSEEFIQIVTENFSCKIPQTEGNYFSKKGIHLRIQTPQLSLTGDILYGPLSPIKHDIMGPFKYFPMECRHGIISMYHRLKGSIVLNGTKIDFTGGIGYMEKDSGTSFPTSYVWVHANDFNKRCSIMASVATIPFLGFHFQGCICIVHYQGQEFCLATYLGVKVLVCTPNKIVLKQGKYLLVITIHSHRGHNLSAPANGAMTRTITESASCPAVFRFYVKKQKVFTLKSQHTSFEYEV